MLRYLYSLILATVSAVVFFYLIKFMIYILSLIVLIYFGYKIIFSKTDFSDLDSWFSRFERKGDELEKYIKNKR